MVSTVYSNFQQPAIQADWLNDVNTVVYGNGFIQAGAGAGGRTFLDKVRELGVSAKDFSGVAANGSNDDTVGLINAMVYCRANNKVLILEGRPRFVATSVPGGSIIAGFGGNYVAGCSMVAYNKAELLVEGKIGFDLSGINHTVIQGFTVTTSGREISEAQLENTSPRLFSSTSGTKDSAIYRDMIVYHNVTNLTGAYRTQATFAESGCTCLQVDNVKIDNTMFGVMATSCSNVAVNDLFLANVQTGVYLSTVDRYSIRHVSLINTKQQYGTWVQRTNGTPRAVNGMDGVLVEFGGQGVVTDLDIVWPIERAAYIQSRDIQMSGSKVLNGEGFKVVGSNRTTLATNIFLSDCHMTLDNTYAIGTGRFAPPCIVSYFSGNVNVIGCTALADSSLAPNILPALVSLGEFSTTIPDVVVKGCVATNTRSLVAVTLMPYTAAQLAVIDPSQTFFVLDGLLVEDCRLVKSSVKTEGSLVWQIDLAASADAKATYAVKNVRVLNNTVDNSAASAQDDWLYDIRYVSGLVAKNNVPTNAAINGFFIAAPTAPYQNLHMQEPFLKLTTALNSTVVLDRFPNLTLLAGSSLAFNCNNTGGQFVQVGVVMPATGLVSTGNRSVTVNGKGYWSHGTAINCGLDMNATGLQYFGKASGGVKTDQVSTPPVGITASAGNLEVRGDLAPTVQYTLNLTVI